MRSLSSQPLTSQIQSQIQSQTQTPSSAYNNTPPTYLIGGVSDNSNGSVPTTANVSNSGSANDSMVTPTTKDYTQEVASSQEVLLLSQLQSQLRPPQVQPQPQIFGGSGTGLGMGIGTASGAGVGVMSGGDALLIYHDEIVRIVDTQGQKLAQSRYDIAAKPMDQMNDISKSRGKNNNKINGKSNGKSKSQTLLSTTISTSTIPIPSPLTTIPGSNSTSLESSQPSHPSTPTTPSAWTNHVWPEIKRKIFATLAVTQTLVTHREGSFEFLGYDVMIDEQLCPWIIEVTHLHCSCIYIPPSVVGRYNRSTFLSVNNPLSIHRFNLPSQDHPHNTTLINPP